MTIYCKKYFHRFWCSVFVLALLWIVQPMDAFSYPVHIKDGAGNTVSFDRQPGRVVCLIPSITEIILALDAKDSLSGITHHSSGLFGAAGIPVVGGFFSPSMEHIRAAKPDLVILSPIHNGVKASLKGSAIRVIELKTEKMTDAFVHIQAMGDLFNKKERAKALIDENRRQLDLIQKKVDKIPEEKRKRVIRLMGRDQVMTPGNDSFQNEMIRAAGGIPPDFGRSGSVIEVTKDEWTGFDPQVIYGCGDDRLVEREILSKKGWKDVDAVLNHRTFYFPCDLTCRASTHLGYFVSWLASRIYTDAFADPAQAVLDPGITRVKPVPLDLDFVKGAEIAYNTLYDFGNKTLVIDFTTPQTIVSTLEGQRDGIISAGNHFAPPACWSVSHSAGLDGFRTQVYQVLGKDQKNASFLFTGADMDNLAVKKETFKEMTVYALVTAGVRSNAMRMSKDTGSYYEPGTINMIFLTNMKLSPRAMTRAIISATEAKTAALNDLDIRSSYQPLAYSATGTGTDNVIVVQGTGTPIANTGGHSKMGELIAKAAYAGVKEAVLKQNGIIGKRDIFQRLKDRRLSISRILSDAWCDCFGEKGVFSSRVENALMDPAIAGFLETAMTISDQHTKGTIKDLELYGQWCRTVAERIAGIPVDAIEEFVTDEKIPGPLAMALNAVFTGVSLHPDSP